MGRYSPIVATNPGGASTNVQYNDLGAFGGDANMAWDKSVKVLTITNPNNNITNPGIKLKGTASGQNIISFNDSTGAVKMALLDEGNNFAVYNGATATIVARFGGTKGDMALGGTLGGTAMCDIAPGSAIAYGIFIRNNATVSLASFDGSTIHPHIMPAGNGGFGITSIGTASHLYLGASTTAKSCVNWATGPSPTSPTEGDQWPDSTQKANMEFTDGIKQVRTTTLFTTNANATVSNTASEVSIIGMAIGTKTLPVNFFVAGKTLRVTAAGYYSSASTGAQTLTIRVKFGATVVVATGAIDMSAVSQTSKSWLLDVIITCQTTGASGSVIGRGYFTFTTNVGQASPVFNPASATAAVMVDTTATQAIDITAKWNSAAISETITCHNVAVEILN